MSYSQTYRPDIYIDFQRLDDRGYQAIIAFYEDHIAEISQLEFDQFFDVYYTYCNALFEGGMYTKFLKKIDWVIEQTILENIWGQTGEDLYEKALFLKAAALHNAGKVKDALSISGQLLRINPENKTYRHLIRRCAIKRYSHMMSSLRMMGIIVLLASSVLMAYEFFYNGRMEQGLIHSFHQVRNIVFCFGLFTLVAIECAHRAMAYLHIRRVLKA